MAEYCEKCEMGRVCETCGEKPAAARPLAKQTGVECQAVIRWMLDSASLVEITPDCRVEFYSLTLDKREYFAVLHAFLTHACNANYIPSTIPVDDVLHHLDQILAGTRASEHYTPF